MALYHGNANLITLGMGREIEGGTFNEEGEQIDGLKEYGDILLVIKAETYDKKIAEVTIQRYDGGVSVADIGRFMTADADSDETVIKDFKKFWLKKGGREALGQCSYRASARTCEDEAYDKEKAEELEKRDQERIMQIINSSTKAFKEPTLAYLKELASNEELQKKTKRYGDTSQPKMIVLAEFVDEERGGMTRLLSTRSGQVIEIALYDKADSVALDDGLIKVINVVRDTELYKRVKAA